MAAPIARADREPTEAGNLLELWRGIHVECVNRSKDFESLEQVIDAHARQVIARQATITKYFTDEENAVDRSKRLCEIVTKFDIAIESAIQKMESHLEQVIKALEQIKDFQTPESTESDHQDELTHLPGRLENDRAKLETSITKCKSQFAKTWDNLWIMYHMTRHSGTKPGVRDRFTHAWTQKEYYHSTKNWLFNGVSRDELIKLHFNSKQWPKYTPDKSDPQNIKKGDWDGYKINTPKIFENAPQDDNKDNT